MVIAARVTMRLRSAYRYTLWPSRVRWILPKMQKKFEMLLLE